MQPAEALFHDAPIFALRLSTLGKGGGCVLACTFYHILGDGMRIVDSLADLGRAYRGESLQPLGRWLHRDLLLPENIHQLLPGGKELVEEARERRQGDIGLRLVISLALPAELKSCQLDP